MSLQPFVDRHSGVTHHREQGELVNDPVVDRRRLEEEQEILARLARQRIEVPEPSVSIVLPGLTLMEKGSAPSALPRVSKRESISTVKTSP